MRFKDRVAIVSGGGSIGPSMSNGRATCLQLAREGAKVVVLDINLHSAEETVNLIKEEGGEALAVEADVLKQADIQAVVQKTLSAYGGIDILFNNVGFGWGKDIVDTPEDLWDRTFDVCVKSVFMVSKHVVPEMAKRSGGAIVNNASVAALQYDTIWAYNASKAAVIKMTRDMAYRYGRHNIRVNCVVPGLIDSALGRNRIAGSERAAAQRQRIVETMVPLRRQGTPEEIARAVAFLASDEASYCNGACLVVDGGLSCR